MFTVIGIMFGGIAIGYAMRSCDWLQKLGKPISYTILLLLFLLGISVGSNKAIVENLGTLGEHLSPNRRNGMMSMVDKIRFYADSLEK